MGAKRPIFFVGPLPPPVHGFSEITSRMLRALQERHAVIEFDVAPRPRSISLVGVLYRFALNMFCASPTAVYLAISGGQRQWIDLFFVALARLCRIPIYAHHHSFSYLNVRRTSASILIRAMGRATHIVLCDCMAGKLVAKYGVKSIDVRTLSNVAFLDTVSPSDPLPTSLTTLRVGFLSNITAEKGIFEFFAILESATQLGLSLQGVIAGPVHQSVSADFHSRLADQKNADYLGPVYGDKKTRFFSEIDVLIFPTRYSNEAEPVTILESLSHAVPVVSFARGCIAGMVPVGAGLVFPYTEDYVNKITEILRSLSQDPTLLSHSRKLARRGFMHAREVGSLALQNLMVEMGAE
jgi:glycosyltransferase involved in cell wall biosynthesis